LSAIRDGCSSNLENVPERAYIRGTRDLVRPENFTEPLCLTSKNIHETDAGMDFSITEDTAS
jgi:hypothetical protein